MRCLYGSVSFAGFGFLTPGLFRRDVRRRFPTPILLGACLLLERPPASNRDHNPPPHASRPCSVPPIEPPAPCTVTLPAHQPHASHRRPLRALCRRPAVCFSNPAAQRAPQAAFPRTLPQCQARCANRYEPRSSLTCPRPATSPLRACPPPRAFVAPRQPRPGLPAGGCRRRNTAAALRARRARGVATHRAGALPRRAERMAALRASAGVKRAIPPRARSASRALGRLARSLN